MLVPLLKFLMWRWFVALVLLCNNVNPTPKEEDLLACIKYLCDEGFITIYQDENDEWFVKIAENV
jgi:hypothetical protein